MADLDSTGRVPLGDGPGDKKPGTRGRTIAIIVLSVLAAILIGIIIWLLATAKPSPTPTPSPTPSASPTPSVTPSPTPTPTPTTTSGAGICGLSALTITLGETQGGAGSRYVPIVFTNKGSTPCTLNGYPTVSFVGNGNGTQIGPSAINDSTTAPSLQTVQPGQAVSSLLRVAVAQNFAGCTAVTPDGFRIAPPGSATSAFVAMTSLQACDNQNIQLLTVQAVIPLS
ncbi:DUF4232 domain-containing protein [Diaminobutyricibacter sp. McL0618]|uniref:DUF4232 domain-containing protein n=1 Tax=Leifsonia sp. McL0618 TaxID=3415677 RepID=UPI003CF09081